MYRWEKQLAKRRNKNGRSMGGIIIGVKEKNGVAVISFIEANEEGLMTVEVRRGKEKWRIVGV